MWKCISAVFTRYTVFRPIQITNTLFNSWVGFFCSFAGCISHKSQENNRNYKFKGCICIKTSYEGFVQGFVQLFVRGLYTDTSLEFIISIVCTRVLYRYIPWIYNFNFFRNLLNSDVRLGVCGPRDLSGEKPTFEVFISYIRQYTVEHRCYLVSKLLDTTEDRCQYSVRP